MPRTENPLDPALGPLAAFALDLRAVRAHAGQMPYRVLAKRAGYCASTLSVAASGATLPTLDVTLAYVQACGADPEPWQARWHELAAQQVPGPLAATRSAAIQDARHIGDSNERASVDIIMSRRPAGQDQPTDCEDPPPHIAMSEFAARDAAPRSDSVASNRVTETRRHSKRLRMSLAIVAMIATSIVGLAAGFHHAAARSIGSSLNPGSGPSSGTIADTSLQQADAIYRVIYEFGPLRTDATDAVWGLGSCRDVAVARSRLQAVAQRRWQQVDQLAALDVSKVPDGAQLITALRQAWSTSARSDIAYANIAADLQSGCGSEAVKNDPNYQEADAASQLATAAKAAAARLWNSEADALSQLPISESEL